MICEYPHDSGIVGVLVVLGGCFCYFWAMQTDVHLDIFSDILHISFCKLAGEASHVRQVSVGSGQQTFDST